MEDYGDDGESDSVIDEDLSDESAEDISEE